MVSTSVGAQLGAEAAVHVGSDGDVLQRSTGQVSDLLDVRDETVHSVAGPVAPRRGPLLPGHVGVDEMLAENQSDHSVPIDHFTDHVIGQVPLPGHNGARDTMGCQDGPIPDLQGTPKPPDRPCG